MWAMTKKIYIFGHKLNVMFHTLAKMCLLLLEVSVEYTNMNGLTKFLQILYGISVSDLPSAASNDRTGHQHKPVLYLFLI
jgi:hypothetical protein